MTDDYDISLDAYLSYFEAIKEMRRKLLDERENKLTKRDKPLTIHNRREPVAAPVFPPCWQ